MRPDAEGEHLTAPPAAPPAAGAGGLSALLVELARAEPDASRGWERVAFPGAVIAGRFELLRELGRGGFGVVFEARDRELGRLVAFKAVRPGSRASAAQRVEWLRREAEAAAQLSHENIVALHDAGRGEHGPFLVFELLDGQTLAERLQRGPLEAGEAIRVAIAVASALAHAHAMGVLHRDLKPSNVFLTARGQVKVLDFGLAHVFGWTGPVSGGTPAYMAPEQWRGAAEDARTDVFALGVMLYEMLTGRLPFAVRDGRSGALEPDAPPPPLDGLPPRLGPVIASAIALDPEARPRNAEALLERLVAVQRRPSSRLLLWRRRLGPVAVVAVAALIAGAAAVGAWRLVIRYRAPPPPAAPGDATAPVSLDAYAHYFRAREAADGLRMEEAAAEIERALELDPEFALAYYLRAYFGEFNGVPMPTRRAHIEAALRFSERLPPKERLQVEAWGAHVRGDDAEAARVYRSALERFPADAEVLYVAGDFFFHAGDLEAASGLFLRAMDVRPGWGPPLAHLVEAFEGLGRVAELPPLLRRTVASAPSVPAYLALGLAYRRLGAMEEAVRAHRAAVAMGGGPEVMAVLGDTLLRAARLDEVEAEGRRLIASAGTPRFRLAGHLLLVKLRAYEGRYREALRLLGEIPPTLRAESPAPVQALAVGVLVVSGTDPERLWMEARAWGSQLAAFHLAYVGDLAHAAELARGFGPGPDRDLYDGLVAWRRGHAAAAVERLRAASRPGANTKPLASLFLGEVLIELGREEEALEALRHLTGLTLLRPRALLVGARALERLGRRDEARARVDELLALWKSADPGLRELAEARALRARLGGSEGRHRAARPAWTR